MLRYIHPAAWVGLALNFSVAYIFYSMLPQIDFSHVPELERETMQRLVEALDYVKPFHMAALACQALALGLMVARVPFALAIAMVSGFLTMPGSLVYLIGCLFTFYRVKFSEFSQLPQDQKRAQKVFRSFAVKKTRVFTIVCSGFFLLFLLAGLMDLASTFIAVVVAGWFCIYRAGKYPALALHDTFLTVTPGLFAPQLMLPYQQISSATLMDNETIKFDMRSATGEYSLVWPVQALEPQQRREGVEELGKTLFSHNVRLL